MFSYDLLRSIVDTVKASDGTLSEVPCLIGLRDRALISVMTFTFARVSAAVGMRVEDYYPKGKRWWVRLHEKGGKRHDLPAHHNLETYLDAYIERRAFGKWTRARCSGPPSVARVNERGLSPPIRVTCPSSRSTGNLWFKKPDEFRGQGLLVRE